MRFLHILYIFSLCDFSLLLSHKFLSIHSRNTRMNLLLTALAGHPHQNLRSAIFARKLRLDLLRFTIQLVQPWGRLLSIPE